MAETATSGKIGKTCPGIRENRKEKKHSSLLSSCSLLRRLPQEIASCVWHKYELATARGLESLVRSGRQSSGTQSILTQLSIKSAVEDPHCTTGCPCIGLSTRITAAKDSQRWKSDTTVIKSPGTSRIIRDRIKDHQGTTDYLEPTSHVACPEQTRGRTKEAALCSLSTHRRGEKPYSFRRENCMVISKHMETISRSSSSSRSSIISSLIIYGHPTNPSLWRWLKYQFPSVYIYIMMYTDVRRGLGGVHLKP